MHHRGALWIRMLLAVGLASTWLAMPPATGVADVNDVVYVSATDGTCAGHKPCYQNLQDAVVAAPVGSTLRVAAGTYTDADTARVGYVVWIYKTVWLEGGWNLAFTERNPETYPTILHAQGLGRVLRIYNPSPGIAPVVEGFVIQGGNATGRSESCGISGDCGGGISSSNAAPLILGNVIAGNVATTNPSTWGLGGGVHVWGGSAAAGAILSGNTIQNNVANQATTGLGSYGGGVYILGVNGAQLVDNQILSNTADQGGGVFLQDSDAADFSRNVISENNALEGGGAYFQYSNGSTFTANTISGNTAHGLLFSVFSGQVHLEGNTFQGNGGSGAKILDGDVTAIGNVITGNGASHVGDECALSVGAPALVEGNTVSGNSQSGVCVDSWEGVWAVIRNNTIADNAGTGLYIEGPGAIEGNLLARNTSLGRGGGIYLWYGDGSLIEGNTIQGNDAPWSGGGIHIQGSNNVVVRRNLVDGNGTAAGGGLCVMGSSGGTFSDNVITGNEATGQGGGVSANGSSFAAFEHNTVSQNRASSGGGLYLYRSGPLTANDITGNQATDGGGVWASESTALTGNHITGNVAADRGGGLYHERGRLTLLRNYLGGNEATNGGAVYENLPTEMVSFEGNTVLDNVASGDGGGFCLVFDGSLSMTNNVLAGNSALGHGDQLCLNPWWPPLVASLAHNTFAHEALGDEGIFVGNNTALTMANNIVVSHTVGIAVDGVATSVQADHTFFAFNAANFQTSITSTHSVTSTHEVAGDPGFGNPRLGHYHLTPLSDALDAGANAGVDTDIDGGRRPGGPGFDIGADEWWLRMLLPSIVSQY